MTDLERWRLGVPSVVGRGDPVGPYCQWPRPVVRRQDNGEWRVRYNFNGASISDYFDSFFGAVAFVLTGRLNA